MNLPNSASAIASVRTLLSELNRDGRGWILLTVAFGWFLGLGVRLAAPTLVPYIRADFGIDLSIAGLLLSSIWVTYALLQFPGGLLGDRVGERNVLVASSALAIASLVVSSIAWSVLALFVGFVLLGSATGIYGTTRFTTLSDIYPDRTATAMGLSSAAGNVGTVLLPTAAGLLAAAASWRIGFAAVTPFFAVAAIGLWLTVPARTSGHESTVDELSLATVRRLASGISNRDTLVLTVTMVFMSFVYQGFTSFFPTYLVSMKGLSESSAALLYSVFFAAGIVIQPVGGAVADSIGDRRTVIGFTVASTISLVLLLFVSGFWSLVGISVILSAQLGYWPIAQAAAIDTLPTEMQGTGFGFLRTFYILLAATAPTIVGTLGDRGFFDEAFLILAGCAFVSALLGLLLWND